MNRSESARLSRQMHWDLIEDLLENPDVQKMKDYIQHGSVTCYEHCLHVSYTAYRICRFFRLDDRAAARGGMLHDFFLYDWRIFQPPEGLHAFSHPLTALRNAQQRFSLSTKEEDVIAKHMWPITLQKPDCWEAFVVSLSDKICAGRETAKGMAVKALRRASVVAQLIVSNTPY